MSHKINILAISGSTRKNSSNGNLIKAIAALTTDIFKVEIFEGIDTLPHFNPDLDYGKVEEDPQVANFRRKISAADAILICTPEYAVGVPGTLKNAIDWTVSTMNFSKKPVALITASTAGSRGHQSLLGTLLIIESSITTDTQVLISSIQTKINSSLEITDQETLNLINKLINSLAAMVNGNVPVEALLPAPLL
ncbi:NAD(P)H-dependent oxidoreductase [Pedobacter gandavensis]|uniref:NADPH-dependent FMN reductase n=1 Tax=Pedobacter TaxID=84567 RepID=UPI001C997BC6|nr:MULTISPECIES: NAD(P)H-dependent oxidoreductase [Pedobacter]WGQ08447.1 NAD(P)H-dependent oxidoreductase [Pedobacter gandavensis]